MDRYLDLTTKAGRREQRERQRNRTKANLNRSHRMAGWGDTNLGFTCKHCAAHVSAEPFISGVGHRNHCPYCLWSRHVDLAQAGDRLCACKGSMRPVGLTLKAQHKKYGDNDGELMLVHQCVECGQLSINRIAADDLPERLLQVFGESLHVQAGLAARLAGSQIRALAAADEGLVRARLFGRVARSEEERALEAAG